MKSNYKVHSSYSKQGIKRLESGITKYVRHIKRKIMA